MNILQSVDATSNMMLLAVFQAATCAEVCVYLHPAYPIRIKSLFYTVSLIILICI